MHMGGVQEILASVLEETAMGEYSKVETDGHLMIVTINRPEVMNALHPMANQELSDAFDAFAANPELWVAIITGAGDKAFSAGNDLKYHAELRAKTGGRPQSPPKGFGGLTNRHDLDKPVIAAVNGVAMGGGFEVALACDIIIASDQARFALPEPRVGLAAGASGMQRLSRQIPLKKAMGMMLTGRHVSAQEGYELGFVTAVVPHTKLMEEARRWAGQILDCSPMSIRATKQVVMRSLDVPALEIATRNMHYPAFVAMTQSKDTIEGPKAFAEKRKPNWKGC
jgi:enoyl-CoA hydratase/carnithine racemase